MAQHPDGPGCDLHWHLVLLHARGRMKDFIEEYWPTMLAALCVLIVWIRLCMLDSNF